MSQKYLPYPRFLKDFERINRGGEVIQTAQSKILFNDYCVSSQINPLPKIEGFRRVE